LPGIGFRANMKGLYTVRVYRGRGRFVSHGSSMINEKLLFGIKMDFFLCVIGMVMIVEGVPYFAAPDRMKGWMAALMQMAPGTLRRFGLVMMVAGLLLVYLGRR